jgi:nitronate monooxygenase
MQPMLSTHLTTQWRLRYPIISAPMAGAAYGKLARAVTDAGGLGMIGMGFGATVENVAKQAAIARGDDDARFGIGLMVWAIERRPELLEAAIDARPFLLSLSFGDPAPYVERARRNGSLIVSQVNTREHARRALEAGVDLIVAQGTESGGHTGHVATLPLLQIVLDEVNGKVPVLAAGGIASARGLAAVLAAGAEGAWIGTPFLAATESDVTAGARERILAATEADTILTRAFDVAQDLPWPAEHPGRALRNEFAEQWAGHEDDIRQYPEIRAGYADAMKQQDYRRTHIYAGQSVGMMRKTRPAAEILREIGGGAEEFLRHRAAELLG